MATFFSDSSEYGQALKRRKAAYDPAKYVLLIFIFTYIFIFIFIFIFTFIFIFIFIYLFMYLFVCRNWF